MRTLVVIPAYNEAGKIARVVGKVPADLGANVLVVDDCSRDDTCAEALAAGAEVTRHGRNRGVGAAIRTGIDHARARGYDVVAILSGDDQHDPSDLRGLLTKVREGYDFVQGSRRLAGLDAPNIGWFRRFFTLVYAVLFRLLTGFPCTDATNGGRAFRTRIFDDPRINLWQDWLDTYELEPYLLYRAVTTPGLRVTEAPMKVIYHGGGTTKMKPFRDWWRILRPMVYLWLGLRQ